jgi:hypothetical protein
MQLPLVVKEKQNRPTITEAEISAMLIKLWLGHSQNLIDLYAAQLRYDETYRRKWCEKAGLV